MTFVPGRRARRMAKVVRTEEGSFEETDREKLR